VETVKRGVDLLLSGVGLVLAAPIVVVSAAWIWLEDRRPVFFTQVRVGRGERRFTVVKLRTMRVNRLAVDDLGQVGTDHALVLRSGRVLRRLKFDELPQLWNVLVGEMSLVGPRPTIPEQVDRYLPWQRERHRVRPGITGWAQVNGNTLLTWDDRILLDWWYVRNRSLWLDLKILLRTVLVAVGGERIQEEALLTARHEFQRLEGGDHAQDLNHGNG